MFLRSLMVLGVGFVVACSSGEEEVVDQNDDLADQVVDYLLPESATAIVLGDQRTESITYGRCETDNSTDVIEINCGTFWSEVSWFQISAEDIAASRVMGKSLLRLDFGLTDKTDIIDRLRVSVHAVNAEGQTQKLASEDRLLDGEFIEVSLANDLDHYIYVARGGTPLTSTRTLEYTIAVTATEE